MADYIPHSFFYSSWAVDPSSGTLYASPFHEGEYRILAFPFEGGDPRVISMEVEPVAKTPEEIQLESLRGIVPHRCRGRQPNVRREPRTLALQASRRGDVR
ncbi:MAG: hypothetical protein MZV63_34570 [Marinilabiliales bacterium]|nr:hypothetical protein [Marinilabiliales bacterium]